MPMPAPGADSPCDADPLALGEVARRWVREQVASDGPPERRLRSLARALDRLRIEERLHQTPTADEIFVSRRGDCVGYAHLFAAMARELGVPVYFVLFDRLERRGVRSAVRVESNHLAVAYGPRGSAVVYDATGHSRPDPASYRAISDDTAGALFHSNRGVQSLLAGRHAEAHELLREATRLDPQLGLAWTNLGVLFSRTGDDAAAELAYRTAIRNDPGFAPARRNLGILLERRVTAD